MAASKKSEKSQPEAPSAAAPEPATVAIGVDIGGTGIKGALVDLASGELIGDRIKVSTPKGGAPDAIIAAVVELVGELLEREAASESAAEPAIGICFPAIIHHGRTMSAANVSDDWIGLDAQKRFSKALDREILLVNDADAAGLAEVRFGAAKGVDGLVIVTTLGTGIGSAMIMDGELIPNSELGHLEIGGRDAERRASYAAKERGRLSWKAWAKRLQRYYAHLEFLFSPTLFLVGGGVSKHADEYLPLLKLGTPIKPAELRNNAGILGAAWLANRHRARH
ncbi:MAG: ROK family protein [Actinomycetales bacterium]|nr:ROK family protein [Actinomycetales bacterium]